MKSIFLLFQPRQELIRGENEFSTTLLVVDGKIQAKKQGAQVSGGYRLVGCGGSDAKLKKFIQVQEAVDVEVKVLYLFHRCLLLCDGTITVSPSQVD